MAKQRGPIGHARYGESKRCQSSQKSCFGATFEAVRAAVRGFAAGVTLLLRCAAQQHCSCCPARQFYNVMRTVVRNDDGNVPSAAGHICVRSEGSYRRWYFGNREGFGKC